MAGHKMGTRNAQPFCRNAWEGVRVRAGSWTSERGRTFELVTQRIHVNTHREEHAMCSTGWA
jgi:hypothetical protein